MPSDMSVLPPALQLKGSAVTVTVLEILRPDTAACSAELATRMASAQLLRQAPVVIACDRLGDDAGTLDLAALLALCRLHTLQPVALRARRPEDIAQAARLGIAVLPARGRSLEGPDADGCGRTPDAGTASATGAAGSATASAQADTTAAPTHAADAGQATAPQAGSPAAVLRETRVVTQPVRGGQQVYARGDLVLLAPVSAGAEVMADGHIHVYAPLRGRALAGVQGDTSARIFCRELGAELLAIAGHYRVADNLKQHEQWGKSAQVLLREGAIDIVAL